MQWYEDGATRQTEKLVALRTSLKVTAGERMAEVNKVEDDFYKLFNVEMLPKIIDPKTIESYDLCTDVYSSNEELPSSSIFKNNLNTTVAVAKNMEVYIKNLKLKNNVYVFGVGDIMPRAIDSIRRVDRN